MVLFWAVIVGAIMPTPADGRTNSFLGTVGGNVDNQFLCKLCDVPIRHTDAVQIFDFAEKIKMLGTFSNFLHVLTGHPAMRPNGRGEFDLMFGRNQVWHVTDFGRFGGAARFG